MVFVSANAVEAAVIYEDNFSGSAGSIVNTATPASSRQPNLVDYAGNRYQGVNSQPTINGSGRAYSTNGGGAVSLALPSLTSGDVITITIDMVTSTTNVSGYIIAGFTKQANTITSQGVLSAGLSGNGRLRVGSGTDTGNVFLSGANDSGAVLSSGTWTSPLTTFVMTYNTGTGGLSINFDNDSISPYSWSGTVAASLADLQFFTFQFNGMAASSAAYVDYMKVEITPVPEPSVYALLFGGLGFVLFMSRRRRVSR